MIFFSSKFSNGESWTLRNVFKIVNLKVFDRFLCVHRDYGFLVITESYVPPAGHEARIDASCTAAFCGEQAAARCAGARGAAVCAVGGGGLAAPRCISVIRSCAAGRGAVLCSVCFAAPSCCVGHGDKVEKQSLCYPLTEQADGASVPGESYVFGVLPAALHFWPQQSHSYFSHSESFFIGQSQRALQILMNPISTHVGCYLSLADRKWDREGKQSTQVTVSCGHHLKWKEVRPLLSVHGRYLLTYYLQKWSYEGLITYVITMLTNKIFFFLQNLFFPFSACVSMAESSLLHPVSLFTASFLIFAAGCSLATWRLW